VVVTLGVTVTFAALAGLDPALAVQVYGPVPVLDNNTFSPKQIIVLDGVILIGGVAPTEIVATACVVQAPVPDNTV
jgi:hypothetical protein